MAEPRPDAFADRLDGAAARLRTLREERAAEQPEDPLEALGAALAGVAAAHRDLVAADERLAAAQHRLSRLRAP